MVREASAALAEASAAASTAQSDVQRLEGELAAAHDAAAAAHGQLQAAVAQEARQTAQAAWHAAALRWHSLRDQHTAARNALGKAQGKERHARVSKLAALRLDAPPAEPSPITTSVIPLPPRPPMPHRRPPADLAAFARQQAELGAVDPDLQWGRMRWCAGCWQGEVEAGRQEGGCFSAELSCSSCLLSPRPDARQPLTSPPWPRRSPQQTNTPLAGWRRCTQSGSRARARR